MSDVLVHYFRSAFCHVGNPTIELKRLLVCVILNETESSVIPNANGIFKILLTSTDRNNIAFMCSKHQVKPFYTQQNNCQLVTQIYNCTPLSKQQLQSRTQHTAITHVG
jgi:hypothetical protein